MSKIKFVIGTLERSLVFQVTGMDLRFRSELAWSLNEFEASNGFKVISDEKPGLKGQNIYLWGIKPKEDIHPFVMVFETNDDRDWHKHKVIEAISEWSQRWTGWMIGEENFLEIQSLPISKLYFER